MEPRLEELRGGAVSARGWLKSRTGSALALRLAAALALGLAAALLGNVASADLGTDLQRVERVLSAQGRVERLKPRLLEREQALVIVLPPWALDSSRAGCTTLALLAPVRTHFVLHVGPGRGIAGSAHPSSAGAILVTRCGQDRLTLLNVLLEMRSPRVVVSALVGVASEPPPPLTALLPERDSGPAAAAGDPGAEVPRETPAELWSRFRRRATTDGAASVREELLPSERSLIVQLEPGCHRLLTSTAEPRSPYVLLLRERETDRPERFTAGELGEPLTEVCTARRRPLLLSIEAHDLGVERRVALAHFPLPAGLPTRFGSEVAERLAKALGGSKAPSQLGLLVSASIGAQGLTLLPRELLPQTCYVAVATVLHGEALALSIGARADGLPRDANSNPSTQGPRLGFCTGASAQVELEVEARGLGVAWLFALFRSGPAAPAALSPMQAAASW